MCVCVQRSALELLSEESRLTLLAYTFDLLDLYFLFSAAEFEERERATGRAADSFDSSLDAFSKE